MCHVHWHKLDRTGEMSSYIRKRLVRIYPPVILAVLVWGSLRWVTGKPMSVEEWFVSASLIPVAFTYAPPVLWTLTFEMAFYALFLVAFFSKRAFLVLLMIWGLTGYVICQFTDIGHADVVNPIFGSGYTFLFAFGVLAYFIRNRTVFGPKARQAVFGFALVIFAFAAYRDVMLQLSGLSGVELEIASRFLTPLFGLSGLLVIIALPKENAPKENTKTRRALLLLGDASFSIYLWHLLGQRIVTMVIARLGLGGVEDRPVAVLMLVGAGLLIGLLVYWWVERPLMKMLMPWTRRKPDPAGAQVSPPLS